MPETQTDKPTQETPFWFCSDGDQFCGDVTSCPGHDICEEDECKGPAEVVIEGVAMCGLHSAQAHRLLIFRAERDPDVIVRHACSACGDLS